MAKPARLMANGYFAGFHACEFASGSVAAPISPIPPERASGPIFREFTAVLTGLNCSFWAFEGTTAATTSSSVNNILYFILFKRFIKLINCKRVYLLFRIINFLVFELVRPPFSETDTLYKYKPPGSLAPLEFVRFHSN